MTQGDPGARCDATGDCRQPTCFCNDGTKGLGPRTCTGICDGARSCETYCSAKGGVAPCSVADGGD